jgi:hypothetical protein
MHAVSGRSVVICFSRKHSLVQSWSRSANEIMRHVLSMCFLNFRTNTRSWRTVFWATAWLCLSRFWEFLCPLLHNAKKLNIVFKAVHTVHFWDITYIFIQKQNARVSKNTIISLLALHVSVLLYHLQGVYWAMSPFKTRAANGVSVYLCCCYKMQLKCY